jgi:WD40 repeat protein
VERERAEVEAEAQRRALAQAQALAEEQTRRAEAERQRAEDQAGAARQLRPRAIFLAALVVIGLVAAGATAWFWQEADRSAQAAIRAEQLTRAQLLAVEGQRVADEQPLLGLRLALEALAHAPENPSEGRTAILQVAREIASSGRLLKIGDGIQQVHPAPDGTIFVLQRTFAPSELRRVSDGALLTPLTSEVTGVTFSPKSGGAFVVNYTDQPSELRRTADGSLIARLPGQVLEDLSVGRRVYFNGDQAAVFVVTYKDLHSELRHTSDGSLITQLAGREALPVFSPDPEAAVFAVRYRDKPSELRRTSDGALVAVLSSRQSGVSLLGAVPAAIFSPDASVFVAGYADVPGELRRTSDGAIITHLPGIIQTAAFSPSPEAASFFVNYRDGPPGELRHSANGEPIATFTGKGSNVIFSPNPTLPVFLLDYQDQPGELRRSTDGALIYGLADQSTYATFSRDTVEPILLVHYKDKPSELRRAADGSLIVTLTAPNAQASFARNVPIFIAGYQDQPGELRHSRDGRLLGRFKDQLQAYSSVAFSPAPELTVFVISYAVEVSELWDWQDEPHRLADLGVDVDKYFFHTQSKRLVIRYTDGWVYLLDVGWLQVMLGDPSKLSEEQFIRLACQPERAGGVDASELTLYLKGQPALACGVGK